MDCLVQLHHWNFSSLVDMSVGYKNKASVFDSFVADSANTVKHSKDGQRFAFDSKFDLGS